MPVDYEKEIAAECDEVKRLLLDKHRYYGTSAMEPIRVFSSADTLEQLRVRMDDKLSRLRVGNPEDNEDAVQDLLGYLVLYRMMQRLLSTPNEQPTPVDSAPWEAISDDSGIRYVRRGGGSMTFDKSLRQWLYHPSDGGEAILTHCFPPDDAKAYVDREFPVIR